MTDEKLAELSRCVPTPFYVFDKSLFRRRAELVKQEFGPKTSLCFSIKANPFLLDGLPEVFDRIEVCSPGELTICEKTHADMKKVIFSGVNKTKADIERALRDGVGTFTAESLLHLQLIQQCAAAHGSRVPILLRLTGGSQFGMDEADIFHVLENRDSFNNIEIVGLHYFTGTQKRKVSVIEKELDYLDQFLETIQRKYGLRLQHLEYGTGLAVDYFSHSPEDTELERLRSVAPRIRAMAEKVSLTIEMGRFFAAPCGYYFTRVMDIKTNLGVHYAILDGGIHQLKYDGQIQGMQQPSIRHIAGSDTGYTLPWTLCGSLCTTADVLARNVELRSLQVGDILVFQRTGAYSVMEGMAVFLSRDMPAVATYTPEAGLKILRDRIDTARFNTPVTDTPGGYK